MSKCSFSKFSTEQLRDKLEKCYKVQERTGKFYELETALEYEINKRNRAEIFKVACRVLENRHFTNQFAAAAHYADAVIGGSDYFSTDSSHEIGSYYTKKGMGAVIVEFR